MLNVMNFANDIPFLTPITLNSKPFFFAYEHSFLAFIMLISKPFSYD